MRKIFTFAVACFAVTNIAVAAPQISVSKLPEQFGQKVITDSVPFELDVRIENTGDEPLEFTGEGLTIAGPDANNFDFTTTPLLTAIPKVSGDWRIFTVTFDPESVGLKQADLVITTNSPGAETTTVSLFGTGIEPRGTLHEGEYTGIGPGKSTIGTGGDYPNLFEATRALRQFPLTGGPWDFLILNDLTEINNSSIAQRNTSGFEVTFRPAPETNPVVTFTTTTQNVAVLAALNYPGHIHIGVEPFRAPNTVQRYRYVPTHNITFDGSADDSSATRSLTFQNELSTGSTVLFAVFGDSDNLTIRNCKLRGVGSNVQPQREPVGGIDFLYTSHSSPGAVIPTDNADNALIENCDILTTGPVSSTGISYNHHRYGTLPPNVPGTMLVAQDNLIRSNGIALTTHNLHNSVLSNNTITLANANPATTEQIGIFSYGTGLNSHTRVVGNRIIFEPDTADVKILEGIVFESYNTTNTVLVANNMISGLTGPPPSISGAKRYGIRHSGDTNAKMLAAHNSIRIYRHETYNDSPFIAMCAGIFNGQRQGYYSNWPGKLEAKNNIISIDVDGAIGIYSDTHVSWLQSDYNAFHLPTSSHVAGAHLVLLDKSLEEWQTKSGHDANSFVQSPFEPASPGAGVWFGSEESLNPDMHFTSFPGEIYLAPPVPGVTTDIDGANRGETQTVIGADEILQPAAVDSWMMY